MCPAALVQAPQQLSKAAKKKEKKRMAEEAAAAAAGTAGVAPEDGERHCTVSLGPPHMLVQEDTIHHGQHMLLAQGGDWSASGKGYLCT